jgi:flagellar FliJ protein
MTRFEFRLESLRALREQAEQRAREELARELARKAEHEAALIAAEERLRVARGSGPLAAGTALAAHELVSFQAYVERRERERLAAVERVSLQEREVGARRRELEHAARERELLERLKSRRAVEHAREVARVEESALGELGLAAHRRAQGDHAA